MKRGLFITFEGPDGSGKSTQIARLTDFLRASGHDIILTREPGGTAISEQIRNLVLDPANKEMAPVAEALLYAASRAQHVAQKIRPALKEGKTVICDRFVDSSYAYQGAARGLGNAVRIINSYAIDGVMPDLTVLLLIDPAESKARIEARIAKGEEAEADRLELEKLDFHTRVYEGYQALAAEDPERIICLDASASIETLEKQIRERVETKLHQLSNS